MGGSTGAASADARTWRRSRNLRRHEFRGSLAVAAARSGLGLSKKVNDRRASSTRRGSRRSSCMRATVNRSTSTSTGGPSPSDTSTGSAWSSASAAGTRTPPMLRMVRQSSSAAAGAVRTRRRPRSKSATRSDSTVAVPVGSRPDVLELGTCRGQRRGGGAAAGATAPSRPRPSPRIAPGTAASTTGGEASSGVRSCDSTRRARSRGTSCAAVARPNRKPCPEAHPIAVNASSCVCVSTPSATTSSSSSAPRERIELMMAVSFDL